MRLWNTAVRAFVKRMGYFAIIGWFAVATACAQLPTTRLYAVLPPGAKQGTQVDVSNAAKRVLPTSTGRETTEAKGRAAEFMWDILYIYIYIYID